MRTIKLLNLKKILWKKLLFPHKQNIFLIEHALSLSNKLCNYSSLITNNIRKCINSNSFEVKSIINISYEYFEEFNEFINLISFIIQNISFKKLIFITKYDHIYDLFSKLYCF